MKNWTFAAIIATFGIIIGFIACDNSDNSNGITENTTVYAVGYYFYGNNNHKACYWKNWVRTDLSEELGESSAMAIAVSEGSIFIAGNNYTSDGNIPLYWKNGIKTELPVHSITTYLTEAITVSEGFVYILGREPSYTTEFYWKDQEMIEISKDGYSSATLKAIAVLKNSVYIAGQYQSDESVKAAFWKDGVKNDLAVPTGSLSSDARSITVSNGSVYIIGYYNDGNKNIACYWKNEERVDLSVPVGSTNSIATAITVSGGSVYIAGTYNDGTKIIVCYWKDGKRTDTAVERTSPVAIAELGGQVYLVGRYNRLISGKTGSWYWENGVETEVIVEGADNCYVCDIVVVLE